MHWGFAKLFIRIVLSDALSVGYCIILTVLVGGKCSAPYYSRTNWVGIIVVPHAVFFAAQCWLLFLRFLVVICAYIVANLLFIYKIFIYPDEEQIYVTFNHSSPTRRCTSRNLHLAPLSIQNINVFVHLRWHACTACFIRYTTHPNFAVLPSYHAIYRVHIRMSCLRLLLKSIRRSSLIKLSSLWMYSSTRNVDEQPDSDFVRYICSSRFNAFLSNSTLFVFFFIILRATNCTKIRILISADMSPSALKMDALFLDSAIAEWSFPPSNLVFFLPDDWTIECCAGQATRYPMSIRGVTHQRFPVVFNA